MPPKNTNYARQGPRQAARKSPPKVMTWSKALPILVVAVVFDAVRIFFSFFWFFGPALLGAYCTTKVGGIAVIGSALAATCVAGAAVGGTAVSAFTTPFGVVMAMMTGFTGFLVLGFWIVTTNPQIFKANATGSLWFVGGFATSQIPFIGSIPAFSLVLWKLYRTQIRVEKAALKAYEAEQALEKKRMVAGQLAERARIQQIEAQEAANEASYLEQEGNEDQYGIPQESKKAA